MRHSDEYVADTNVGTSDSDSLFARSLSDELCDRQSSDWQAGHHYRAEYYLNENIDWFDDENLVLDLIYNELVQREQAGEHPQLEEYCDRFPSFAVSLERLFEVHQFVECGSVMESASQTDENGTDTKPSSASCRDSLTYPRLDGYEIIAPIGRGGMGIVYLARQQGTDRQVAVKVFYSGGDATPEEVSRFATEAQAAARLRHPSIVSVHEAGSRGGVHFLAMEWIDGESLADRLSHGCMSPRDTAMLVKPIAQAVHYAHTCGVIHRDLKPHNILLDAAGQPHIADFGLARFRDHESTWTTSGQILGTLSYMSPEQASGESTCVGFSSDIYGLGGILYHALTGQPPLMNDFVPRMLQRLVHEDPKPPSAIVNEIPPDLENICLKCLRKEPRHRYSSAEALADDLERFLDGRPVEARPLSPGVRLWRTARRRPLVSGLIVSTVFLLAITFVGSIWAAWQFKRDGEQLASLLRRAESAESDANYSLLRANITHAEMSNQSRREGRKVDSLRFIDRAVELSRQIPLLEGDSQRLRNALAAALSTSDVAAARWQPAAAKANEDAPTIANQWFEQATILSARYRIVYERNGTQISIDFRSDDGHVADRMQLNSPRNIVGPAAISDDLRRFAVIVNRESDPADEVAKNQRNDNGHPDGAYELLIWDLHSGESVPCRRSIGPGKPVGLAWNSADHSIVVATAADGLWIIDPENKERTNVSAGGPVAACQMHPERPLLAVWAGRQLRVVDLNDPAASIYSHVRPTGKILSVDWRRGSTFLAVGTDDHFAYIFEAYSLEQPAMILSGAHGWTNHVSFAPGGRLMVSCDSEDRSRIYDVDSGQIELWFEGVGHRFSESGEWIEGVRDDESTKWSFEKSPLYWTFDCDAAESTANHGDVSDDGKLLVLASWDEITFWSLDSRQLLDRRPARYPYSVEFLTGNRLLVLDQKGLTTYQVDADSAQPRLEDGCDVACGKFSICDNSVTSLGSAPLIASTIPHRIDIARINDRSLQRISSFGLDAEDDHLEFTGALLSPDGNWLVTGFRDSPFISLYDVATNKRVAKYSTGDSNSIYAFDPNSKILVYRDGRHYRVIDLGTMTTKISWEFDQESDIDGSIAINHDGSMVAISHYRHAIDLVDARTGEHLIQLPQNQNGTWLKFTPDGKMLYGRDVLFRLRAWDLERLRLETVAHNVPL